MIRHTYSEDQLLLDYEDGLGRSSTTAEQRTGGTDGPIVRSPVDAQTAERSGESGEMIEPEEDL
jgi:hypothetical protein